MPCRRPRFTKLFTILYVTLFIIHIGWIKYLSNSFYSTRILKHVEMSLCSKLNRSSQVKLHQLFFSICDFCLIFILFVQGQYLLNFVVCLRNHGKEEKGEIPWRNETLAARGTFCTTCLASWEARPAGVHPNPNATLFGNPRPFQSTEGRDIEPWCHHWASRRSANSDAITTRQDPNYLIRFSC